MERAPLPSDAPFGAKVVDFGQRAAKPTTIAVAGLLVILLSADAWVRPKFVDRAIVEIGTKFIDEPLVHPVPAFVLGEVSLLVRRGIGETRIR